MLHCTHVLGLAEVVNVIIGFTSDTFWFDFFFFFSELQKLSKSGISFFRTPNRCILISLK